MSLWKILGIVAGAALAGAAIYAGVKITKSYLREKALEEARRLLEEARRRNIQIKAIEMMLVKKIRNNGEHNKVDVGLLDESGCEVRTIPVNGDSIASDIHEGMVIPLAV